MNQNQRDLRRAAAQAFMESLNQLETSFNCPGETSLESCISSVEDEQKPSDLPTDLSIEEQSNPLEEAVADIEQFIQTAPLPPDQP